MHTIVKVSGLIAILLLGPVTKVPSQTTSSAQQPAQEYEQRVTRALDAAKKSADALNERRNALVEAIRRAADPQQAQKVLDELISSAKSALDGFGENSDVMQAVDGLLSYIDIRRKSAENELKTDPTWADRVNYWKAQAESLRELRQALLREADRTKASLDRLQKERKRIEDVIAGEGVEKAKQEMQKALQELKNLGDSLDKAVVEAQQRQKSIGPASF
jgi:uncharacterized protein YukE